MQPSPISYGVNANIYPNVPARLLQCPLPKSPSLQRFILFAPAQASGTTVSFSRHGPISTSLGVTVAGVGGNAVQQSPEEMLSAAHKINGRRINALFADLHCETMAWTAFANTTASDDPG